MAYGLVACALVLYIQYTSLTDSLSCLDNVGSVASVGELGESWFGEGQRDKS